MIKTRANVYHVTMRKIGSDYDTSHIGIKASVAKTVTVVVKTVACAAALAENQNPGYEATDVICQQTNVIVEDYNYD